MGSFCCSQTVCTALPQPKAMLPPFPTHFINRVASVPYAAQRGGPGQADTGSTTFLMGKEGMGMEGNGAEWLNWKAGSAMAAPNVCEEGIWR